MVRGRISIIASSVVCSSIPSPLSVDYGHRIYSRSLTLSIGIHLPHPCPVPQTARSISVFVLLSKILRMPTVTEGTVPKPMPSSAYPTPPLPLSTAHPLPSETTPESPRPWRNNMRERDNEYGDRFVPNHDSGDMRTSIPSKNRTPPQSPTHSKVRPLPGILKLPTTMSHAKPSIRITVVEMYESWDPMPGIWISLTGR